MHRSSGGQGQARARINTSRVTPGNDLRARADDTDAIGEVSIDMMPAIFAAMGLLQLQSCRAWRMDGSALPSL
jgi:hypothetical protein